LSLFSLRRLRITTSLDLGLALLTKWPVFLQNASGNPNRAPWRRGAALRLLPTYANSTFYRSRLRSARAESPQYFLSVKSKWTARFWRPHQNSFWNRNSGHCLSTRGL